MRDFSRPLSEYTHRFIETALNLLTGILIFFSYCVIHNFDFGELEN